MSAGSGIPVGGVAIRVAIRVVVVTGGMVDRVVVAIGVGVSSSLLVAILVRVGTRACVCATEWCVLVTLGVSMALCVPVVIDIVSATVEVRDWSRASGVTPAPTPFPSSSAILTVLVVRTREDATDGAITWTLLVDVVRWAGLPRPYAAGDP